VKHIAVYAGSFDPITLGHANIIHRAAGIFEKLHVAIGVNSSKKPLFETEERLDLIKRSLGPLISSREIVVESFEGLLVNHCVKIGADVIVRGLRAASDFDYELGIAQANKTQQPSIETVFLNTDPNYSFVASSIVREIARYGGNVRAFVAPEVEHALWKKFDVPKKP
jgi:pantetheine-phosphate adenylyltransferase